MTELKYPRIAKSVCRSFAEISKHFRSVCTVEVTATRPQKENDQNTDQFMISTNTGPKTRWRK